MKREQVKLFVGMAGTAYIAGIPFTGVMQEDELGLYVAKEAATHPESKQQIPPQKAYFDPENLILFSVFVPEEKPLIV